MKSRDLRSACLAGFAYGAVLYGGTLSLIHVVYSRLGSVRDALMALVTFALLYGLWAAATFAVGFLLARFRLRRGLFFGILLFNLMFWVPYWLYGMTYDQVLLVPRPLGPGGMLAYAAGLGLLVALAAATVSWLLFRLFELLARRGWLARAAAGLFVAAVLVHAAAPLYASPGPAKAASATPQIRVEETGLKVVVVGLDGADWQVLQPMIDRGELPNFAAMKKRGASGEIRPIRHTNSPVLWASIYTGAPPSRHGVQDFYRVHLAGMGSDGFFPVHQVYAKEMAGLLERVGLARRSTVSRYSISPPPIWEIADRLGMSIGVVDGYFFSFPALRPSRPESFFLAYGLDEYNAQMGKGGGGSRDAALFAQPVRLFRQVRPLLSRGDFYWQSAALLELLKQGPQPKLVNLYTHQPDVYYHWYWKWLQPGYYLGVTPEAVAENGGKVRQLHQDFDRFLGDLRARLEPNTVLVVVSDHGHSPTILHSDSYSQHWHGPPGILLMEGGPVKPGAALSGSHVLDVFPTLAYLLGMPVPEDAPGKVLLHALDPELVRRHPVRTIPSYDVLGLSPGLPGVKQGSGLDRQELEKLKSLGYL
ncbi:MAG TPA: alkaline phosphatase family protein [Thermoanaerobaculia bacterium]|nr:alkaline phosphatase family protein [Thermoanaerobaculia bacterium]